MGYYSDKLAGTRLKQCYDIAPPRVRQYLRAEVGHLLSRTAPGDAVLELGCGYGRIALEVAAAAGRVVGIDTAAESLALARSLAAISGLRERIEYVEMDAAELEFDEGEFDLVFCAQNGICAFGVEPERLVREAVRVTRQGGLAIFSTYSSKFWPHRLRWFELQAEQGLMGEVDYEATGGGVIVCRDGFRAGAMAGADFRDLCRKIGIECSIREVDGSSLFCEMAKPKADAPAGP